MGGWRVQRAYRLDSESILVKPFEKGRYDWSANQICASRVAAHDDDAGAAHGHTRASAGIIRETSVDG